MIVSKTFTESEVEDIMRLSRNRHDAKHINIRNAGSLNKAKDDLDPKQYTAHFTMSSITRHNSQTASFVTEAPATLQHHSQSLYPSSGIIINSQAAASLRRQQHLCYG